MVKKLIAGAPADVTDVTAKPAGVAPDVLAGLDALIGEAGASAKAGEQQQQAAAAKQEKSEVDTIEADLLSALDMAAAPAKPAMWWLSDSEFEALWGQKVRKGIAESGAVIMRRHGLSMGGLMQQYGPYIGLVAAVGPSLAATVSVYKAKKQEQIPSKGGGDASS